MERKNMEQNNQNALRYYQKGREEAERAIENNAQHKNAYYNRGLIYASLGHHERAIEDFDAVLALDPDEGRAYNNRGIARDNLGNYQTAIADYEKAIALNCQGFPARAAT